MEQEPAFDIVFAGQNTAHVSFSETTFGRLLPLCTMTQRSSCKLVDNLTMINRLLFSAKLELREMPGRYGQLSLLSLEEHVMHFPVASEDRVYHATHLLYWLLKEHACVQHLFIHPFLWDCYGGILCDGLNRNPYIKTIKVWNLEFGSMFLHEALCSLRNLEEFECVVCMNSLQFPFTVLSLLQQLPSLKTLKLSGLRFQGNSAKMFVAALKESTTLRELHIHGSLICHAGPEMFSEYLMAAKSLLVLSVDAGNHNRRKTFGWMAAGLAANNTVQNLKLKGVTFDAGTAQQAARMLTENRVLRNFTMVSDDAELAVLPGTDCACLHTALTKNDTVERLDLPFCLLEPCQWVQFFWTVSRKHCLQRLTIDTRRCDSLNLRRFCRTLKESGAETKVSLGTLKAEDNLDLLESRAFSDVSFHCFDGYQGQVSALILSSHLLTRLKLYINTGDAWLCLAVAAFIREAPVLRSIWLQFRCNVVDIADSTCRAWTNIFKSLASSTSIQKLRVDLKHGVRNRNPSYEQGVELLADVINISRSIRRVSFKSPVEVINKVFFRRLYFGIADNYILVSIDTFAFLDKTVVQDYFAVWDAVRRNASFVTLAADFTDGRTLDRRCVRALERVLRHPPLLEELAEQESLSVAEASAMVRRQFRRAEGLHDFMRFAGVVKKRVECNSRADGRLQLDDLNEYCWRTVRSYLMIDDIRDPAATTLVYR